MCQQDEEEERREEVYQRVSQALKPNTTVKNL